MNKIKIGSLIGKRFDPKYYTKYHNQDLPKPQVNCEYFVYVSNQGWMELRYYNGVFYSFNDDAIHSYWVYYLTMPDTNIIKGKSLQGVPLKYLNKQGSRLAWSYKRWIEDRALSRNVRHNVYKIKLRLK